MDSKHIKDFYSGYADEIVDKRLRSPYALRRYAHEAQYQSILKHVKPGMRVLDAGCGEGVLSVMMAKKGAIVTGCDLSAPNIEASKKYASEQGVGAEFIIADLEKIPFEDNTFDLVVSSHVLEHLPDFDKGLREVMRVSKNSAVVAIPTLLNFCSLVQVGGGWFYLKGVRSFFALSFGLLKLFYALIFGKEGVDESYGGGGVPHVFRFPWIMKKKIRDNGFNLVSYEASSVCFPYFASLLPLIKFFDEFRDWVILRNFGYGTTYIIKKMKI